VSGGGNPRSAAVERKTGETDISVRLVLDGSGSSSIATGIGFFDHMLISFAKHGLFDLEIRAAGDLQVDQHHLVEDVGIVLGKAFAAALGEKRGIARVGSCLFPMDETLARAAVDLSGRPFLVFEAGLSNIPLVSLSPGGVGGSFQVDTLEDFWLGFTANALCALHLDVLRGRSDHHKAEALFKAAARSLRDACSVDPRLGGAVPSTKGVLA